MLGRDSFFLNIVAFGFDAQNCCDYLVNTKGLKPIHEEQQVRKKNPAKALTYTKLSISYYSRKFLHCISYFEFRLSVTDKSILNCTTQIYMNTAHVHTHTHSPENKISSLTNSCRLKFFFSEPFFNWGNVLSVKTHTYLCLLIFSKIWFKFYSILHCILTKC